MQRIRRWARERSGGDVPTRYTLRTSVNYMNHLGEIMGIIKKIRKILSRTIIPPKKEKDSKSISRYKARYYRKNKSKARGHQLKYKFGITLEEYNRIDQSQGGVCAICEGVNDTRTKGTTSGKNVKISLAVDHNHKTGKVRGLLCGNCNTSLGSFKDNPALLRKAIEYLERETNALDKNKVIG